MNDSVFRGLVIVLLVAICALLGWTVYKLDRVRYAIPDEPRGLVSDVDQIQRDVAKIREDIHLMAPTRPATGPFIPPLPRSTDHAPVPGAQP